MSEHYRREDEGDRARRQGQRGQRPAQGQRRPATEGRAAQRPRPRTQGNPTPRENPFARTRREPSGRRPESAPRTQRAPQQRTYDQRQPQQRRTVNDARSASFNRSRAQANRENPANAAVYRDYARYTQRRAKRPGPISIAIMAAVVIAIGVGIYMVLNPANFDVTINGAKHTVSSGTTIGKLIDDGYASPKAGNLLAVDSSVLTEGGGDRFEATVNGEATNDGSKKLHKNDVVDIEDGSDTTEDYDATTEDIPYERVEDNNYWNGSLHVYIAGQNGVRTTKTGKVSGKTVSEDTTPAVNEEYKIYTANTGDDKVIALTFDDGPWKDSTSEILDILKENDAHATFFTIGKQIADHADVVKRAYDEGNEICTHTWDHAAGSGQGVNLTYMSADEQVQEVQKGFDAIKDVTGEEPTHIMRAPGGNFKGDIVWTLQPYIDAEIGWNIDTEDWRRPGADTIASRIMKAKPGNVILMHDGGGDRSQTVEALRQALPKLKAEGYRFVTVSELLKYDPPAGSSAEND